MIKAIDNFTSRDQIGKCEVILLGCELDGDEWMTQTLAFGKETDEDYAIEHGEDIDIYGYVPDDLFDATDSEIISYIEKYFD